MALSRFSRGGSYVTGSNSVLASTFRQVVCLLFLMSWALNRKFGSIRDVAKEAGLSIATVSRVINGARNVAPDTRERVLHACKTLDYLPNPAAKALATKRSRTVAAIIPTIDNSVFAKFIAALEEAFAKRGYSLVLAISNADEDEEFAKAQKLVSMGAEAFVLTGAAHKPELYDLLRRRMVPFVITSVWNVGDRHPAFGYDNYMMASQAIKYLNSKGHTEIAVLHGPMEQNDRTRMRRAGALSVQSATLKLTFYETSLDVRGGKDAIHRALADRKTFTAALCFSDVLALGAYVGLGSAGKTIPNDISVMGFDNIDWSEVIEPPLTTIDLPAKQIATEAATQIIAFLEEGAEFESTEFFGSIVERNSVASIR